MANTRKYTILMDDSVRTASGPFGLAGRRGPAVGAFGAPAAEPRVEDADLTPSELLDQTNNPRFRDAAPHMPTILIQPLEEPGAAASAAAAWGIQAVAADTSPLSGSGVTVAVLDTGIDSAHPAFAGVALVEEDFSGDGNGDVNGHGTHCAGTIFGRDVNGTRIGVARGVDRALIGKVLGDDGRGTSDMMFQAIQWATNNGARVLSMSLGFDFPGFVRELVASGVPIEAATSIALDGYRSNLRMFDTLMEMIDNQSAFGGGSLVVAASGNESDRPNYEVSASIPAAARHVTSVGALGQAGGGGLNVAPFSNTFPQIAAPGVSVVSARNGGGLRTLSGTSMACPHVAGVAALWWEQVLGSPIAATPTNVLARLITAARQNVFAVGVDPATRGVGLATAPQ